MKYKYNKKANRYFFISSLIFSMVYFIPYLIFNWMGAMGLKDPTVPKIYQLLQIVIPAIILFIFIMYNLLNRNRIFYIDKPDVFLFIFIIILLFRLQNYINYSGYIKLLFFCIFYLFTPHLDIKKFFKRKNILYIVSFIFTILFLEMTIFPYFNIVNPFVKYGYIPRYVANLGGPNILGIFSSFLFIALFINQKINYNTSNMIPMFLTIIIVLSSVSLSATFIIIIGIILSIYFIEKDEIKILKIIIFSLVLVLIIFLLIIILKNDIYLVKRIYLLISGRSQSAINRLNIFSKISSINFNNIILGNTGHYYFSETIFFTIFVNFGIAGFTFFGLFIISKIIQIYNFTKINIIFNYQLVILILIQIYSLVNPIYTFFPFFILIPFLLKLRNIK